MSEITITLCNPTTGQSESLPVSNNLKVSELLDWSKALLGGLEGNNNLALVKDGKPLSVSHLTLSQAGIHNGDLIVVTTRSQAPAPPPRGGGGLDFSSLLGGNAAPSSATGGNIDFSNLLLGSASAPANENTKITYYPGMPLSDAIVSNPHPKAIVKLLRDNSNLFKELNYYNPILASKMKNAQSYEAAVEIWREDRVKGSISSATKVTQVFHEEKKFTDKLNSNPNDVEAKEYFAKKKRKEEVQKQYEQVMQEYPESMGRVLMLYIDAKINDHTIQAFVDSGAQSTIMSKKCAQKCGIFDLVDTRFEGYAVGVGTGKILGRIHLVQLQIGHVYFPCSVTVMDDSALPTTSSSSGDDDVKPKDMDFLLGLDMLKRHTCCIDLEKGNLKFRLAPGKDFETPFLHEKDLDQSKGGTKGFNAEKANNDLKKAQKEHAEKMDED